MLSFERHIPITATDISVMGLLTKSCELSNHQLKSAIDKGALWISRGKSTQRLRRIKSKLNLGDTLHFYYNETVLSQEPSSAILLADHQDYSIWYKPYGMLSQGSKWSDHCTIERWVQKNLQPERPVFVIHRLDKAATGIMVLAHSKKAARLLAAMFEHHQLEKYYQIIVHGCHSHRPQPDVITTAIDGKSAESSFSTLSYDDKNDVSLVKVKIESGRKHQIRKHAASINFPVVGDRLHGDQQRVYPEVLNLQLCSVELNFTCPINGISRETKLPQHLCLSIDKLIELYKTD